MGIANSGVILCNTFVKFSIYFILLSVITTLVPSNIFGLVWATCQTWKIKGIKSCKLGLFFSLMGIGPLEAN